MRHNSRLAFALAAAAYILSASPGWADSVDGKKIATEGNGKGAVACISCHGADGLGQPAAGFPRLAGLNAAYLAKQLHDFKSGARNNPVMKPMAASMTDSEITAVAGYFAGLPAPTKPVEKSADAKLVQKGEEIATKGVWSRDVPACFQCHGPGGEGVGAHFPAIVGQSATYITNQITAWKSGARTNDPIGLMKNVAAKLKDDEVKAVAAYLSTLKPAGR